VRSDESVQDSRFFRYSPRSPTKKRNGEITVKKNEFSEFASNLLIVGSVSLAFTPFVLGDRLILVVTGLMKEGGVMIDQFSNYLTWLVS
jgi:hypothetical protein